MFDQSARRVAEATGRSLEEARATLEKLSPLGRAVRPGEVAALVHFLATAPEAAAITGAEYVIDGGETA
jgi:NAD(P)-dependent dehydrogenase (short-subunit alcohol dehydrogenase family)